MNDPIDAELLDALRRDRARAAPEDARGRVASRLDLEGAAPSPGRPPRTAARAGAATGWARSIPVLVATFAGGMAGGAWLHGHLAGSPAPRVVYVDHPTPAAPSALSPATSPGAPPAGGAPSSMPAEGPATPRALPDGRGPTLSQLDAERALLDKARSAWIAGEADRALALLDRYAQTFRRPILGEERDAMTIQALVRAGRYDEARARANAFRRASPQSLLLPAVDAAMAAVP